MEQVTTGVSDLEIYDPWRRWVDLISRAHVSSPLQLISEGKSHPSCNCWPTKEWTVDPLTDIYANTIRHQIRYRYDPSELSSQLHNDLINFLFSLGSRGQNRIDFPPIELPGRGQTQKLNKQINTVFPSKKGTSRHETHGHGCKYVTPEADLVSLPESVTDFQFPSSSR